MTEALPDSGSEAGTDRRTFLRTWTTMAWVGVAASAGAAGLGALRLLLPHGKNRPSSLVKSLVPEAFPLERVFPVPTGGSPCWVVRNGRRLYALKPVCTHLGCVLGSPGTDKVLRCPCHGSRFDLFGEWLAGPAPRALERYRVTVDPADGRLVVDLSKTFRQERGEWSRPEAFVWVSGS